MEKDYKEKYRYIFKTIKSLYGKREFAWHLKSKWYYDCMKEKVKQFKNYQIYNEANSNVFYIKYEDIEQEIMSEYQEGFCIWIMKIDTPPPTISGNLHIGHIFSYCHIDIMARYWRSKGLDVNFPIGLTATVCQLKN